jgi:uncharacterized protein YndB with AHSA1/START domain
MRAIVASALLGTVVSVPAGAEVKRATANGFEVESRVVVPASPRQAFEALGQPQLWWHPDHTYSGSAANLRMGLTAGNCFCEAVPADNGSIEHAQVVYSRPGTALRLHGALGPLQSEAVTGSLTWSLKAVAGGTEVTQTYVAGGFFRQGAEKLAPAVDQVLSTQLSRYRDHLAKSVKVR